MGLLKRHIILEDRRIALPDCFKTSDGSEGRETMDQKLDVDG
jgi:hypothetical protein